MSKTKTVAPHMFVLSRDSAGGYLVTIGSPFERRSKVMASFHTRFGDDGPKELLREWVRDNVGSRVSADHVVDTTGMGLVPAEFSDFYMEVTK